MRLQGTRAVSGIAAALVAAALTFQAVMPVHAEKIPENDQYYQEYLKGQSAAAAGRMVLPSAGINYALSADKVSLRDVEEQLVREGKALPKSPQAQSGKKGLFRNSAAGIRQDAVQTAVDIETAVNDAPEESRIQTTLLTPVQMREKTLVDEIRQQGIDDISSVTAAMSSAVQVVVDTRTIEEETAAVQAGGSVTQISTSDANTVSVVTDFSAEAYESTAPAPAAAEEETDEEQDFPTWEKIETPAQGAQGSAPGTEAVNMQEAGSADASAAVAREAGTAGVTGTVITEEDYVAETAEDGASVQDDASAQDDAADSGEDGADPDTGSTGSAAESSADNSEDGTAESAGETVITESDYVREDAWLPSSKDAKHSKSELVQFNLLNGGGDGTGESDADGTDEETAAGSETTEGETAGDEAAQEGGTGENDPADAPLMAAYVDDFLYIRSEPNPDAEVVGKLYSRAIGRILEDTDENGWMKIQSGEVTGYVLARYTATADLAEQIFEEVRQRHASIHATSLRVHVVPELESDVITLIWQGMEYDVLEELDGWYKVNTVDGIGYISADYTDYEEIIPEAISRQQEEAELARQRAEEEARRAAAAAAASKSGSGGQAAYVTAEGSAKGQEVANFALQFLGNPYVWGGTSLTNGADCSGFTMSVYAHFGVSLPHYDASQRQCGTAVASLADAVPGDLICYNGHIGIYIGGGRLVHASSPKTGIIIGNADYRPIVAIRRIFN